MEKKKKGKSARKGLLIGVICLAAVLVLMVAAALVVWNINEFALTKWKDMGYRFASLEEIPAP